MNIAFLLDSLEIGGTELNATRTLEALGRRGLRLTVLHYRPGGALKPRIEAAGHALVHIPTSSLYSPRTAGTVLAIRSVLQRQRIAVVHAQDVYSNILAVLAGRVLGRRAVLTSRRWKDAVPRPALLPLNAWAHRHSTLVLPNSGELVASLLEERVTRDRIVVHENFIDDAALVQLPQRQLAAWRAELGIPPNGIVIGCVARLSAVKRHDRLLDAFARVCALEPNVTLVLVGDGPEREAIAARANHLAISHRVVFTGTLPHTPLPQQLFDIAVLTSENEGFPNSIVEALACSVPVVATLVGGTADILRDNISGIGVRPGDQDALVSALLRLTRDPELRQKLGQCGRIVVSDRFSEAAAIDRLLAIYDSVTHVRLRSP